MIKVLKDPTGKGPDHIIIPWHEKWSVKFRIDYTNHQGIRAWREIRPIEFWFGANVHHKMVPQWFLAAYALDRDNERRSFAMKDIHAVEVM